MLWSLVRRGGGAAKVHTAMERWGEVGLLLGAPGCRRAGEEEAADAAESTGALAAGSLLVLAGHG